MDDELRAALDAVIKADQEEKAAKEKLNAALLAFINLAATKAKPPAGFTG